MRPSPTVRTAAPLAPEAPGTPTALGYSHTGARLGTAVLVFVSAIIGAITLVPFHFAWPTQLTLMLWATWFDAVANVTLFLPLGFVYALTNAARTAAVADTPAGRQRTRQRMLVRALLGGALVSLAIELTQVFEPGRYPSPVDVATNALGALIGAWGYTRAARQLGADTPLVGRLALELPVMGLVYVSLPLCTLAAISAAATDAPLVVGVSPRAIALVLLGLFGGALMGTVQRRQLGPTRALAPRTMALVASGWFIAGALPALATAPAALGVGALLAALVAWDLGRRAPDARPIERRFETEALLCAAPFFAAYLLLLPLGDPRAGVAVLSRLGIMRQVETMAAFTIGGYLLAEAWGRRELRYRFTAWRVGLASAAAALTLAVVRREHGGLPVAALVLATQVVAGAYGGWLYHLQRAHVQALVLARRARTRPATVAPSATRRSAA